MRINAIEFTTKDGKQLQTTPNEDAEEINNEDPTRAVTDHNLLFASTPLFCILRILLTMALVYNWSVSTGDVSVAFLRAEAISYNLVMRPPHEFYNDENRRTMWRLNKATYGLRSSSKQWQDHIAHILTVTLGLVRCTTESNVYRSKDCQVYIMIYVDDLLFIAAQNIINTLFSRIQKQVLLRHTGDLTVGSTIHFLGRNISHKGNHIDISLRNNNVDIALQESGMTTCNPAPSPGVPRMKGTAEDEAPLHQEQRKKYRRLVGKIKWLAHTRPDIGYGAKELARSLQAPTQLDNKKLKHMTRYLKGTGYSRHNLRPRIQILDKRIPLNIDTYTDANWASCETTRKSATGFTLYFFAAAVHYGSKTQATIALSSAESELYAIGTAAQESLYISNFVKEAFEIRTNIRIHTDSSSAKSIAINNFA